MSSGLVGRFRPIGEFEQQPRQGYKLLPLRFIRLSDGKYLLTNLVGEYIILEHQELRQLVDHKLLIGSPLYQSLKARHMIYDDDSSVALDLLSAKYRTKMEPVSNFTALHMFVVTLRCDHSCPYCQVSRQSEDREKFDMTRETADKAIDFTFRSPSKAIKIEFQGGESLLNFDLIKYIVQKAKARNLVEQRELQFVIATNLSPMTPEILEFCRQEDVLLSTSLDGPSDLHNLNRPRPGKDSYQRAISGINQAREVLGPDKVGALMTTTKASLNRPEEIIEEYLRNGFNGIFLRPLSPYGFAIKTKSFDSYNLDEWLDFYRRGLEYIIRLNQNGTRFVEYYAALVLEKLLTPFGTNYVDLQSPAGIGIGGIVFNYDGDVYASDEARMLAEMGDKKFRLGNLQTQSYPEIMLSENLLDPLESSVAESVPMCTDCAYLPYCGADPVFHHATQGDSVGHKAFSQFCKKNMWIIEHLIARIEESPETKRIFYGWLRI